MVLTTVRTDRLSETVQFQHCGDVPMALTGHGVRFQGRLGEGYAIDTYTWRCPCGAAVDITVREPDYSAGPALPADGEERP